MKKLNMKYTQLFEYTGQNVVTPWDRLKKHIFGSYPIITAPRTNTEEDALQLAWRHRGESDMVWIVDDKATPRDDFPWHYRPNDLERAVIHEFPRVVRRTRRPVDYGDIKLVPTNGSNLGIISSNIIGSYHEADFDIFMISFHEEEADQNFAKLKQRFPDIQHIKNVQGIGNAHREAGIKSKSEMVYVVDADALIADDFKFDYIPPMNKRANTTYVWQAKNPVNDLVYGYGAVKLFPRQQLVDLGHELPDYTTGVSFYQPVKEVSNTTGFNKDPYRTWRSAFRECAKLASKINPNAPSKDTTERLNTWCTVDNGGRFGRYCVKGALEGKAFGEENKDNIEELNKINDYEWLRTQFVESMKKKVRTD